VEVVKRSGRFVVTANVRARLTSTGETVNRFIRFATDELPSLDGFRAEANRILQLGVKQADSDMELEDAGQMTILEQVEIRA
jgi:hypothetical protein